jgi:hypothetical protein
MSIKKTQPTGIMQIPWNYFLTAFFGPVGFLKVVVSVA